MTTFLTCLMHINIYITSMHRLLKYVLFAMIITIKYSTNAYIDQCKTSNNTFHGSALHT